MFLSHNFNLTEFSLIQFQIFIDKTIMTIAFFQRDVKFERIESKFLAVETLGFIKIDY